MRNEFLSNKRKGEMDKKCEAQKSRFLEIFLVFYIMDLLGPIHFFIHFKCLNHSFVIGFLNIEGGSTYSTFPHMKMTIFVICWHLFNGNTSYCHPSYTAILRYKRKKLLHN